MMASGVAGVPYEASASYYDDRLAYRASVSSCSCKRRAKPFVAAKAHSVTRRNLIPTPKRKIPLQSSSASYICSDRLILSQYSKEIKLKVRMKIA